MSMSAERIVEHIISANCDAGAAGREVLLALVAANLQEADESGSDREYEAKAAAQALLFQIATLVHDLWVLEERKWLFFWVCRGSGSRATVQTQLESALRIDAAGID